MKHIKNPQVETLNEFFISSCKPNYKKYQKFSNNIILIENFFQNFDEARNFFIGREKWKCLQYQGNDKPGLESIFPSWIGKSLLEKYILDHKIVDDINSYESMCNLIWHEPNRPAWSLSNSNLYPHFDGLDDNEVSKSICLVNLSTMPIITNFYSINDNDYCNEKMLDEYHKLSKVIWDDLINYYDKEYFTINEIQRFMDKTKYNKLKIIKKIKYNPNQAIVYSANLFHSANISEEFTENNPRILLKIGFDQKILKSKNITYL